MENLWQEKFVKSSIQEYAVVSIANKYFSPKINTGPYLAVSGTFADYKDAQAHCENLHQKTGYSALVLPCGNWISIPQNEARSVESVKKGLALFKRKNIVYDESLKYLESRKQNEPKMTEVFAQSKASEQISEKKYEQFPEKVTKMYLPEDLQVRNQNFVLLSIVEDDYTRLKDNEDAEPAVFISGTFRTIDEANDWVKSNIAPHSINQCDYAWYISETNLFMQTVNFDMSLKNFKILDVNARKVFGSKCV